MKLNDTDSRIIYVLSVNHLQESAHNKYRQLYQQIPIHMVKNNPLAILGKGDYWGEGKTD